MKTLWLVMSFLAQRDAAVDSNTALTITLPAPVLFGELYVRPGLTRVTATDDTMTLAEPTSMRVIGTLPVTSSAAPYQETPSATVVQKGTLVRIELRIGNQLFTAEGQRTERRLPSKDATELLSKHSEARVELAPVVSESDRDMVARAVRRYAPSVTHCGELAKKQHWQSGDKRFLNCACALTQKWRLPSLPQTARYDHAIGETQAGMTFDVTTEGRVENCQVWVGQPPVAGLSSQAPPKD